MKAIDNDSENKLWMKMTAFVKWIMNENDSISEIEWIWENRWKWITKRQSIDENENELWI